MRWKKAVLGGLAVTLAACGGGGSGSSSEPTLKANIRFVDAQGRNLSAQGAGTVTFPEGVDYVYIEVCEVLEGVDVPPDPCPAEVEITRDAPTTSYTFDGLTAGKKYNVTVWAYNSAGTGLYAGGAVVTLREGENTVNITAVGFPWKSGRELRQYNPPVNICAVFYDLRSSIYTFVFDPSFPNSLGFYTTPVNLVFWNTTGTCEIVSDAEDNGQTYTVEQLIPVYDDGKHYDGSAGDGIWGIRLRCSSIGDPFSIVIVNIQDPIGQSYYDYWFCGEYPTIYKSDMLSELATATTGDGDDVITANEDVILSHNLSTGTDVYKVFPIFESSASPLSFENFSEDKGIFEQLVFRPYDVAINYTSSGGTGNTITLTSFLGSEDLSWVEDMGYDQVRFLIVNLYTGKWQISEPLRFSF